MRSIRAHVEEMWYELVRKCLNKDCSAEAECRPETDDEELCADVPKLQINNGIEALAEQITACNWRASAILMRHLRERHKFNSVTRYVTFLFCAI